MPQALPTILNLAVITLRLQSQGKIKSSPFSFTDCPSPFLSRSALQCLIMTSATGCKGTTNSTFVFCRSFLIYFCPSAAVWICPYCKHSMSAMVKPVKQAKKNICLTYSASLSFTFKAMSLATSLFCRKCIFCSGFSYLVFSKGLYLIILWMTTRVHRHLCPTSSC